MRRSVYPLIGIFLAILHGNARVENKNQILADMERDAEVRHSRLSEKEIKIKLRLQNGPVRFLLETLEDYVLCSPFVYCSNRFLDDVCPGKPREISKCRVTSSVYGGDRDKREELIGYCEIEYMDCAPDNDDNALSKSLKTIKK